MPGFKFEWTRGHAYECGPSTDKKTRVIRQVGGGRDRINPFELSDPELLVAVFANLDGSEEQCLAFARKFGLLNLLAREGHAERVDVWKNEIRKTKAALSLVETVSLGSRSRRVKMKLAEVDVFLRSGGPGTKPALVYEPRNLHAAMFVQLAQHEAGGGSIRPCAQCGQLFAVGGSGGRRPDSKFHSDACKSLFHYHQQQRRAKK